MTAEDRANLIYFRYNDIASLEAAVAAAGDDLAGIIMDARGYLFPGRFGGHVEESYIGDHISRLLPDGYAAHTLRHRFATTAYAATHDLFVVAELLGHESVETTEHYVAMPDGRLREATTAVRLDV